MSLIETGMNSQPYLPGLDPEQHHRPSYEIFPYERGQYVYAVRDMPVRGEDDFPTGETWEREVEGEVIRADNQRPPHCRPGPSVTIKRPSGGLFNVWHTEIRVRWLHGRP